MSMHTALAQTRLERPKVSVIVPVYNSSKYLRECLDSILNQTLKEIEVIIIDDGKVYYPNEKETISCNLLV